MLAPIVLFIYNRPHFLQETLHSLQKNELVKNSILIVYADGAKPNATAENLALIAQTRAIIKKIDWVKEVRLIERNENFGLSKSIFTGVSEVVNEFGKAIVLEDDLELSPFFLQFMNESLDLYENNEAVLSIGACNYFANSEKIPETFFYPVPDCWGWATWKNRWDLFENDAVLLQKKLRQKDLIDKFNLHGAYDFSRMLQSCIDGKINSWSVKWLAVAILENKLSLYPKFTISKHIGIDKNATHQHEENYENMMIFPKSKIKVEPQEVRTIPFVYDEIRRAFFKINAPKPTKTTFNQQIKFILKEILPPFLWKILSRLRNSSNVTNHNPSQLLVSTTYLGNYSTWQEAQAHCEGYDAPQILEKVKSAILKVKNGEAIYERDSVLFDKIQYSWGLLSGLLRASAENEGNLSLIDFGGSLGSTYFQCRSFLTDLKSLDWNIVEQKHFVEAGNKEIEDENLHFFYTIDEVLSAKKVNVLLLSSVLPHLENPYQWLNVFFEKKIPYLIIDRTSFCKPYGELLTIQYVPEKIEKSSYRTWFFDEDKFLAHIEVYYEKIADFLSFCDIDYQLENEKTGIWKGFIFRLKD